MGDQRAIQLRLVRPLLLRVPLLAALGKSAGARGPAFGRRGDLRRGRQRSEIRNSSAALIVAVFALVLLLPLRVFEIGNPDWRPLRWIHAVVVVTITLLAVWAIGGVPWLRHFAFPIAFILVAVPWVSPIEAPIVQGLMRLVAAVAAEAVNLCGIPAQLEGNLIRVSRGRVGVSEACSGVRALQTALMIGLLFGELKRFTVARRAALVAVAIALSVVANFFRTFFLVLLAARHGVSAVDRWHDFAGYSIVALVFVGTMTTAALLSGRQKSEVRDQKEEMKHRIWSLACPPKLRRRRVTSINICDRPVNGSWNRRINSDYEDKAPRRKPN